jgi:hypothetical protein
MFFGRLSGLRKAAQKGNNRSSIKGEGSLTSMLTFYLKIKIKRGKEDTTV